MPVLFERIDTDILVIKYDNEINIDDAMQPLQKILEITTAIDPDPLHVIYDVRTINMKFDDFISYVSHAAERRREGKIPANLKQHVIGTNQWMQSLRNWFSKQYHIEMTLFTDLDAAIDFINEQKKTA